MPIKILSSGDSMQESPDSLIGSALKTVGRNVYRAAPRVVEGTLGLPGNVEWLAGTGINKLSGALGGKGGDEEYVPTLPTSSSIKRNVTDPLQEKLGISKEWSEPQGKAEEVVDRVWSDLPFLAVGGAGSLLSKLGRSGASHIFGKAAEEAGAGPVGSILASTIGGTGFDMLNKTGWKGIRNQGMKIKDASYKDASKHAKGKVVDASTLKEGITKEFDSLGGASGLKTSSEKEIRSQMQRIFNKIDTKKGVSTIPVQDAWDLKKHFNNIIKDLDPKTDGTERRYYERIVNNINKNAMDPASAKFKEFGIPYKKAENLHIGIEGGGKIKKLAEKNADISSLMQKNPLVSAILGGGTLYALGPAKVVAGATGALSSRTLMRAAQFYGKSSEARKLLKDIASESLLNNTHQMKINISKLNHLADEYEEENPYISRGKIKILKG